MKRTVALALLGVATAVTAYGQGGISIGNYIGAYVPMVYDNTVPVVGTDRVASTDGVTISVWWGEGDGIDPSTLVFGADLAWNGFAEGNGYVGYFGFTDVMIPGGIGEGLWAPGETWTFQLRATGTVAAAGPGQVVDTALSVGAPYSTDVIGNLGGSPPDGYLITEIPGFSVYTTVIPEPSTFALAGLGAAALLIFRRRD